MNTDEIVKTDNFHAPVLKNKKGDYRMKPGQTVYLGFSTDFLIREADPWRGECWDMIRERRDLNFIFLTKRIERFMECLPGDWGDGYDNVTEAIKDSCNVFFYETGLRMGIEKIDTYAALFGLGQKTGLELYEEAGEVAGPEVSAKHGQTWYEGDTMYAAIGQGNTKVTPIQLANYIATLVNGGSHYPTHLLKTVKSSDFSQVVEEYRPEARDEINLDPANLEAVKYGMGMVASEGSAAGYFKDLGVKIGVKTGTAQVARNSEANALLVAFAPYDNPEIAVSLVVEKGGSGSPLASIAADILRYYFSAEESREETLTENTLIR